MLILTRRPNETIVIDDRIFITVVGIKDDFIRIRVINLGEVSITCTREIGESFNIGDSIKLSLIRVKGIQVRIGIEAPKELSVHREEIYQRIQAEKAQQAEKVKGAA